MRVARELAGYTLLKRKGCGRKAQCHFLIFLLSFTIRLLDLVKASRIKVGVKPLFIKFIFLFFLSISHMQQWFMDTISFLCLPTAADLIFPIHPRFPLYVFCTDRALFNSSLNFLQFCVCVACMLITLTAHAPSSLPTILSPSLFSLFLFLPPPPPHTHFSVL